MKKQTNESVETEEGSSKLMVDNGSKPNDKTFTESEEEEEGETRGL